MNDSCQPASIVMYNVLYGAYVRRHVAQKTYSTEENAFQAGSKSYWHLCLGADTSVTALEDAGEASLQLRNIELPWLPCCPEACGEFMSFAGDLNPDQKSSGKM